VLMDKWRPDGKVGSNQTGFWGAVSFPSVSIKDRSLLVPLVILNTCLIFSWPNKVPFDREASDTFWAGINSDWQISAKRGLDGDAKSKPKVRPGSRLVLGSAVHDCYPTTTWKMSLVICSSLDR
jgi:hypothetical protein